LAIAGAINANNLYEPDLFSLVLLSGGNTMMRILVCFLCFASLIIQCSEPTKQNGNNPGQVETPPFNPFSLNDTWTFYASAKGFCLGPSFSYSKFFSVKLIDIQLSSDSIRLTYSVRDSGIEFHYNKIIHTDSLPTYDSTLIHIDTLFDISKTFKGTDTANILISGCPPVTNWFPVAPTLQELTYPYVSMKSGLDNIFASLSMGGISGTWGRPYPGGGDQGSFKLCSFNGEAINSDSLLSLIGK
jgi:hypothetical protein